MKKLFTLSTLILALVFTTTASAQKFAGLDKSPLDIAAYPSSYKVANKLARVVYSRPQLKGRAVSQLAPAGSVWRTGANEAAEITFYKDATIGGKSVKAGTYSLFTIPGDKEWTIILNSKLNQWGAYSYDESADVVRVKGGVNTGKDSVEAFSVSFAENEEGASLVMGWGKVRVYTPIKF